MRSTFIRSIIAATAMATASAALAQNYPTRPIRIVVVSTPGGSVDTMARTVGPKLAERWGQQVLVDNRPGAGGAIAAEIVAKAPPDGYTLIMGTVASFATNVSLHKKLSYDPVKDFSPITLVATQNLMLLVHPSVPAKSVKELTAMAKKQPGKLSFASAGNGTGGHLSGELYKMLAQIDMLHVPYKGVQPALIDVVSGQVSMTFASIISAMPQVKNNRLRPLAVTGGQRSPAAKELPTMIEAGVKGYESATWYGLLAPAGTPPDILNFLNGHAAKIMQTPDMKERMKNSGSVAVGSTREAFAKHLQIEFTKWAKVIKASGATVD